MTTSSLLTVAVPILIPYLTEMVKNIATAVFNNVPAGLKPALPIVTGIGVTAIAHSTGVQLPTDLTTIQDTDIAHLLGSGIVLGSLGHTLHAIQGAVKTHVDPAGFLGKLISAVAGSYEKKV